MSDWKRLVLVALLLSPASLSAQVPVVPLGARIRVRQACDGTTPAKACTVLVGKALTAAGDSLFVEDRNGVVHPVDLHSGARLERSAGYKRHTLLGLGLGTLVGLGSGAVLASDCMQGGGYEDDGLCNIAYLITIPAGAGIGALLGAISRTERWVTASSSGPSLRVWSGAGHTTVGVTARF